MSVDCNADYVVMRRMTVDGRQLSAGDLLPKNSSLRRLPNRLEQFLRSKHLREGAVTPAAGTPEPLPEFSVTVWRGQNRYHCPVCPFDAPTVSGATVHWLSTHSMRHRRLPEMRIAMKEAPVEMATARLVSPAGKARGLADRTIVSCGIGSYYREDMTTLERYCDLYCGNAWRLYYHDYPDDCPTQRAQQSAFKMYAWREAVRLGFRYVLWLNAVAAPVAPIDRLWKRVETEGWYVPPAYDDTRVDGDWLRWATDEPAVLGDWCSDEALRLFGITRPEADCIPMGVGAVTALDLHHPVGREIYQRWNAWYEKGAFNGAHFNVPGESMEAVGPRFRGHVSDDAAVHGHKHATTALSFVLWELGLKMENLGFLTLESEQGFLGKFVRQFGVRYRG